MNKIKLPLTATALILLAISPPHDGACDEPYRNPYSKIDYALTVEDAESVYIPHVSNIARDALRRVCNNLRVSIIVVSDRKLENHIPTGAYSLRKAMQTIFPDCQHLYYENTVVVIDPVFVKANPSIMAPLNLSPDELDKNTFDFFKHYKDTSCIPGTSSLWVSGCLYEGMRDNLNSTTRPFLEVLRIMVSKQAVHHILDFKELTKKTVNDLNANFGGAHKRAYSVTCTPGVYTELPEVSWSRPVCVLDQGIKVSWTRKDGKHIEWVIKNVTDKQRILFPNAERFAALYVEPNVKDYAAGTVLVYQAATDVIPDKVILQPGETFVVSFDLNQARVRKLRNGLSFTQTEATCMLKAEDFTSDYEQMTLGWNNIFYPIVEYHDAAGNIFRASGTGMRANGVEWDMKPETGSNK